MQLKLTKQFYYRCAGETESELYKKFNTCKENVLRNNPNIPLFCGEWLLIKTNNFLTHIVKPAENLDYIAKLYNTEKQKIIEDNNLLSEKTFIGQHLKIFNI